MRFDWSVIALWGSLAVITTIIGVYDDGRGVLPAWLLALALWQFRRHRRRMRDR